MDEVVEHLLVKFQTLIVKLNTTKQEEGNENGN
jgi:hypothetical protein